MTTPRYTSLAQAVQAHYQELVQFIRRRTGSLSTAEEVVQETWIRANSRSASLPDNPRAYLYRVAGNLAVDHIRRQGARSRVEQSPEGSGADGDSAVALEQLPSPAPGPADTAISLQQLAILSQAVEELPDKCREVFLLYRGRDLSMREVAKRLGIAEKTVEKHIARAMVHCRKRLREAGREV